MDKDKLVELKAQVYDINVEMNKLGKQWEELKKKKELLRKQIEEKPAN